MMTLQERVHSAAMPKGWKLDKLHQTLKVRRGNKNVGMREDNLLSLSYGRIIRKDIDTDGGLLPESFETYQVVEDGDIIMRLTDLQNDKRSLRQGLVKERGIITSAYDALEVVRDNEPRFWAYALLALDLAKYYYSLGGGVRQSVKFSDFPNEWIYRPDLPTQNRIAAFLDRETARIDELIEKKERLVVVQRLRLQSSLQEMVLGGAEVQRGLGGDWLQSLSDGWRLMPLKHLVTAMGGATPSKDREDFWTGDIPWVSPKDMKTDVITDVPDHVSQAALDGSAIQMVPEKAVLIVVRGMILARLVPVCRLGVPATINQDMKALLPRTKVIRSDYLQRMLQGFGDVLMSFIEEAAHGTKKLRSDALFGLKFPVPPLDQQEQIAGRYEAARASAEKIEDATRRSIDRLREYRAALITAAVTGQIDVETYAKAGNTSETLDRIEEEMQA